MNTSMASSSSSTSLSQETEVLHHPYQRRDLPGPKGAFETRQLTTGLYIRVDMPGVPPENLKLRKYSDTRIVTFSAKAPIVWDNIDSSSERVYAGYVILDKDPLEIHTTCHLSNGCLRIFFPNADGSLHSLSSNKFTRVPEVYSSELEDDEDPSLSADAAAKFFGEDQEMLELNKRLREVSLKEGFLYKAPKPDESQGVRGGNMAHINPFLLSGVEGVYENRVVHGDTEGRGDSIIYVRMDMPDISEKQYSVGHSSDAFKDLLYEGTSVKESPYDEGGRRYLSMLYLRCSCCTFRCVKDEMKDGVLRLIVSKSRSKSNQSIKKRFTRQSH